MYLLLKFIIVLSAYKEKKCISISIGSRGYIKIGTEIYRLYHRLKCCSFKQIFTLIL